MMFALRVRNPLIAQRDMHRIKIMGSLLSKQATLSLSQSFQANALVCKLDLCSSEVSEGLYSVDLIFG